MWVHVYWWLENNNLWKACVAWSVGLALNAVWAVRLWIHQMKLSRQRHSALMDKLDTETPGGLGEIKKMITGEQDPDDNGSDTVADDTRRPDHVQGHSSFLENIHIPKGGGSAGHR